MEWFHKLSRSYILFAKWHPLRWCPMSGRVLLCSPNLGKVFARFADGLTSSDLLLGLGWLQCGAGVLEHYFSVYFIIVVDSCT